MSVVDSMSIDELASLCATETEKFNRQQPSDMQFCFELFRRALAGGATEAFTRVYRIYERQVHSWIYRHPQFPLAGESAEFFASAAWSRFFFALRGAKFAGFLALPQVLGYLKQCVFTVVALHMRDQQRAHLAPLDPTADLAYLPDLQAGLAAQQVAQRITALLPDPRDRLLAHCAFAQGLRPREIVQAYPGRWNDERAVSIDLYRIRRMLRGDAELRQLLGIEPGE